MMRGVLAFIAVALLLFGVWGSFVWPGPFPYVLAWVGLVLLLFASGMTGWRRP